MEDCEAKWQEIAHHLDVTANGGWGFGNAGRYGSRMEQRRQREMWEKVTAYPSQKSWNFLWINSLGHLCRSAHLLNNL